MEKRHLKITIAGEVSSGKSTIYYIIKEALKSKGIDVEFKDPDHNIEEQFDEKFSEKIDKRIEAIKDKTEITIEQIQLNRKLSLHE